MGRSVEFSKSALLVIALCCLGGDTHAAADPGAGDVRFEVSVGFHAWPDVEDLQPHARGELDEVRINVACAVHWPLNVNGNDALLVGFDSGLFPSKSDVIAGGGYLLPSVRWRPGEDRALSVDAGFGFYKVDFGEIAGDGAFFRGTDAWRRSGFGGFIGGTWNIASAWREESDGLMMSFEIHFVNLGTVDGRDLAPPRELGTGAGKLNRGFYQLHLGYNWE